ncbi:hypothetical protein CBP27_19150 [Fischerella thermalis WC542]|nr:hypothetical protein CBP17_10095 [Fischerella thermalis WC114]PLZ15167.1 hypothetical protein CBP18_01255 [Fischerella thermalis WC119]PLZ16127.1 hypothetical protein CBP19_05335 [Fischerella thermalis WC1110]PLZ16457.1 hypothetical protein CBP30_22510 [Fischerella thermalis WC157]PLZ25116.1 hypothetical protein CBP28_16565 [Fischerella thermalis WC559]PLZ28366.1 hypothetical protein CBP10_17245 [Fischerella thermalis WC558]PLZ28484.1 hypothetical protein CBP29_02355 [Fischerella thermalis
MRSQHRQVKLVFDYANNVNRVNDRKQIASSKLINAAKIKIKKLFPLIGQQLERFFIKSTVGRILPKLPTKYQLIW